MLAYGCRKTSQHERSYRRTLALNALALYSADAPTERAEGADSLNELWLLASICRSAPAPPLVTMALMVFLNWCKPFSSA
jgi:hypothetical protein